MFSFTFQLDEIYRTENSLSLSPFLPLFLSVSLCFCIIFGNGENVTHTHLQNTQTHTHTYTYTLTQQRTQYTLASMCILFNRSRIFIQSTLYKICLPKKKNVFFIYIQCYTKGTCRRYKTLSFAYIYICINFGKYL